MTLMDILLNIILLENGIIFSYVSGGIPVCALASQGQMQEYCPEAWIIVIIYLSFG